MAGVAYTLTVSGIAYPYITVRKKIRIEDIEYYEYDCGNPCTEDGCMGHSTDVPVSFTINGVRVDVNGYLGGDFPGDNKEEIRMVKEFVEEFRND